MGVNNDKYFYVNRVGLLRTSRALQQFLKDAEEHHMLDQPGKLMALRITEYYALVERLGIAGQVGALAPLSQPVAMPTAPTTPHPVIHEEEEEEESVEEDEQEEESVSEDLMDDAEDLWAV